MSERKKSIQWPTWYSASLYECNVPYVLDGCFKHSHHPYSQCEAVWTGYTVYACIHACTGKQLHTQNLNWLWVDLPN